MDKAWQKHKQYVCQYYDALLDKHGPTIDVADLGNKDGYLRRYEVLSEVCDFTGKSVLDVGCGLGSFCDYLYMGFYGVRYTGVDLSERMIEAARKKHPGGTFIVVDIFERSIMQRHDIVIGNGIFYLLKERQCEYMMKLVEKMYESAKEAVAFNCLSRGAKGEFWAKPYQVLREVMAFCPKVTLRADYLPNDFTVYMYK